ncbi:uncharacterized protein F54H12.2-like [Athalia rosae]|uniref:uncharacterized protein F54H12.2-like n=1 Tax=Athalia rosae TaxID=37344 RepID=UPI0020346056|nr:uncharacterized protein F54H12.2-like [Athalia rosae]
MAFLHARSSECTKSELDLFSVPPTQTSIESGQWIHYKPVSSLTDDSPIEFAVPGHGDEYIDLAHTMLSLRVQLRRTKEETTASASKDASTTPWVTPINNLLHSMFNQVDIFFNQKPVSPANNSYAYRAYIETLLNYAPNAKQSHLTAGLWYDNKNGETDICEPRGNDVALMNGFIKRNEIMRNGRVVDLIGHLHCDVFNQEKFLLNGVELRVRLVRSRDSFCLMETEALHTLHILEASLLVRRVKISPGILLAHARTLAKGTAKYPVTRVEVKAFTIHAGVQAETLDNVILGQLPKRVILGLVSNKAFNGDRKRNPFNFQHFMLNYLSLYVDGIQIPSKALQPSFGKNGVYVDTYHTLFSGTGVHFLNEGCGIGRLHYEMGNCLTAFDLTPDLAANCSSHWSLIKHGTLRIELRFDDALKETINCIVYAEFDNIIEVDASRQVVTDFGG